MVLNNKAAMFGLDARIAVAVIGTLSIVTSAILYAALTKTKASTYLTNMTELGKAWEQYYIDTNQTLPPADTGTAYRLHTRLLIEDTGVRGWSGPYLDTGYYTLYAHVPEPTVIIPRIDASIVANASLKIFNDNEDWTTTYSQTCHTAGWPCSVWASNVGFPDDLIFEELDKIVDGSDGKLKGKLRMVDDNILLRVAAVPNPVG